MSATVRGAVLLAAETLEENPERWLRGDLCDRGLSDSTCACAIGMVQIATHALDIRLPRPISLIVGEAHDDVFEHDLVDFNDNYARSAAEVAARLRHLAEYL